MTLENRKLKVLWAIDAFDDFSEINDNVFRVLRRLAKQARLEISPVYMLSPEQLGLSLEFSEPWTTKYEPAAREALARQLKSADLPGLGQPMVLSQPRASLRATVEMLADFARVQDFDLIVAGSHGRRGFARMELGSFAEELLLQSALPVLVVGGRADALAIAERWEKKDLRILIPNDLSSPRSHFFDDVMGFASTIGAKATVFSVTPKPIDAVKQSGVYLLSGGWVTAPYYAESELERRKEDGAQVLERAKDRGVPCELVLEDARNSVTELILERAKNPDVTMIAMAAESGRVATAFVGSITRQVMRQAPCAILVVRCKKS